MGSQCFLLSCEQSAGCGEQGQRGSRVVRTTWGTREICRKWGYLKETLAWRDLKMNEEPLGDADKVST